MIELNRNTVFSEVDLDEFELEPVPKYIEKRGYIYLILDSAFPEFFKIGRTQSLKKRLAEYNNDKPFPTAYYVAFSCQFDDVHMVEKKILEALYKQTSPTTLSYEWFEMKYFGVAISLLMEAEKAFSEDGTVPSPIKTPTEIPEA